MLWGGAKMPYIEKKTIAGDYIRVEKHYSSRYGSKGKCIRGSNFSKTDENTKKRNLRYAKMKANDIFNKNFKKGDMLLVLTFAPDKRPSSAQELKTIWKKYARKIRNIYKKANVLLKWQSGINPSKKNPHIHLALTSIDVKLLPEWEYGGVHISVVDGRDYHTFGSYTVEQSTEQEKDLQFDDKTAMWFSHSRNCEMPKVKVKVIYNDHWASEPKAPKGFYIIKDSLENWEDECDGYKHQAYILCAISKLKSRR